MFSMVCLIKGFEEGAVKRVLRLSSSSWCSLQYRTLLIYFSYLFIFSIFMWRMSRNFSSWIVTPVFSLFFPLTSLFSVCLVGWNLWLCLLWSGDYLCPVRTFGTICALWECLEPSVPFCFVFCVGTFCVRENRKTVLLIINIERKKITR